MNGSENAWSVPSERGPSASALVVATRRVRPLTRRVFFPIACSCLLLSACQECREQAPSIPTPPGQFGEQDLVFMVNGRSFALNSDVQVLLRELGPEYRLTEAPSCVYDGTDKSFEYASISLYTYPLGGTDLIDEIILTGPEFQTPKGLRVGNTLQQAVESYGANYRNDGGIIYYCLDPDVGVRSPCLYLVMEGDAITSISFYSASNVE